MSKKNNKINGFLWALIIAVVSFFVIFLLFPDVSYKFFGVSVKQPVGKTVSEAEETGDGHRYIPGNKRCPLSQPRLSQRRGGHPDGGKGTLPVLRDLEPAGDEDRKTPDGEEAPGSRLFQRRRRRMQPVPEKHHRHVAGEQAPGGAGRGGSPAQETGTVPGTATRPQTPEQSTPNRGEQVPGGVGSGVL